MPNTSDYLNKLVTDKNALADNLVTMGVEASQSETFTSLVPKVLDIQGGGSDFPTVSYTFESDFSGVAMDLFNTYILQHVNKPHTYSYIAFKGNSKGDYYVRDMQTDWFENTGTTYFSRYEPEGIKEYLISNAYSTYVKAGTEMVIYTLTEQENENET